MLRVLFKLGIILFFLWHGTAVLTSAFATVRSPATFMTKVGSASAVFRPYILLSAQHQDWNLFAPDPLLRVTEMSFEKIENGTGVVVRRLDGRSLGFFPRAPELRIMWNMLGPGYDQYKDAYIQDLCRTEELPVGARVFIRRRQFDIPGFAAPLGIGFWRSWKPEWIQWVDFFTLCKPIP